MDVIFRVDASNQIGTGHLHRCMTLAQALQSQANASITFLAKKLDASLASWVQEKGIVIAPLSLDLDERAQCLDFLRTRPHQPDWLVVDHYEWDFSQESPCRPFVRKILVIDDLANREHDCDVLVDQNYFRNPAERYEGLLPSHARRLLGTRFALLAPVFAEIRSNLKRSLKPMHELLISFGGSDPGNNTLTVLQAIEAPARLYGWKVRVVIGACHAERAEVERLARSFPQCECLYNISDMAQKMAEAQLFIGSGGTTTWERMALGLPGVVIAIAENQEALSQALAEEGYQLYLGSKDEVTQAKIAYAVTLLMENPTLCHSFSTRSRVLVDGKGASRVAQVMTRVALVLRPAEMSDCNALHTWRNDESIRKYTFQPEPIPIETHRAWFKSSLENPDRVILIGEDSSRPVGVLRYDFEGAGAIISIYLVPGMQGKGYGAMLLESGTNWLKTNRPDIKHIDAEVFSENIASRRAFEKAGYREYHHTYRLDLQETPLQRPDGQGAPALSAKSLSNTIRIGNREIGPAVEPFIIAEMSGNHNGSLERALELVDAAARAGADALKIQTYTADTMTLDIEEGEFFIEDPESLWKGESLYRLYEKAHTPWDWQKAIFDRCREHGMIGFSSPFDPTAVDFLEELAVPLYKIASFEIVDLPLIRKVAATGKPMIISTGMATEAEIGEAVHTARVAGCESIVLLKCTSSYPADPSHSNLRSISYLRETFGTFVGLSDHTLGIGVAVASIALGACVIEKHFTLDRADGGVDSAFSLEPDELRHLKDETRQAHRALGGVSLGPTEAEIKSLRFRRSLYATQDIAPGEALCDGNVRAIRPGFGLMPKHYDAVLGKRAKLAIKRGTPLNWDLLE